jgi:hypothetical protein
VGLVDSADSSNDIIGEVLGRNPDYQHELRLAD